MPGRVEALNGTQICFEVHGSGEPLVLLHGFSGSSQDWLPTLHLWDSRFQFIIPDLRGHGRSAALTTNFRHDDAAVDVLALLDLLGIKKVNGVGISGGGNVLLHLATMQQDRIRAMVLVSATSHFPEQARAIMRNYRDSLPPQEWERLRRTHPGGDGQIESILASVQAFADSNDDLQFTPADLATISARAWIVQGDRDPLYPVEISREMARSIPNAQLSIVPGGGHGPVFGEHWPQFVRDASAFLMETPR